MRFADWTPRPIPADLEARYVGEGFWTDDTLGAVAADGLARLADTGFFVHSAVHAWQGTFGDVVGEQILPSSRNRVKASHRFSM